VVIYAYDHHVRVLSPEPLVVNNHRVYSGVRSRRCYGAATLVATSNG
jgi:hypothetical protein